jgi:hypothetical protein
MLYNLSDPRQLLRHDRILGRGVLSRAALLNSLFAAVGPVSLAEAAEPSAKAVAQPAKPVPPLPPWPDPANPPGFTGPDSTEVHFESSSLLPRLLQETPDGWRTLCSSTCTVRVDPSLTFGVAGYQMRSSRPFSIPRNARVDLRVTPRLRSDNYAAGFWAAAAIGATFAIIGGAEYPNPKTQGTALGLLITGGIILPVTLPLSVIWLYRQLRYTKVDITPR